MSGGGWLARHAVLVRYENSIEHECATGVTQGVFLQPQLGEADLSQMLLPEFNRLLARMQCRVARLAPPGWIASVNAIEPGRRMLREQHEHAASCKVSVGI